MRQRKVVALATAPDAREISKVKSQEDNWRFFIIRVAALLAAVRIAGATYYNLITDVSVRFFLLCLFM